VNYKLETQQIKKTSQTIYVQLFPHTSGFYEVVFFERVQYVSSTKNLVNLYDGGRKTKNGQARSESQPDNHGRDVLHSATPRVWRLLPLSLGDYRVLSFILSKPLGSQQAQNLLQSENKNSNKCSIVEVLFSLRIIVGTTNIHFYTCASRLRVFF